MQFVGGHISVNWAVNILGMAEFQKLYSQTFTRLQCLGDFLSCCYMKRLYKTCAKQIYPKDWGIKNSAKRHWLLWFLSGLIYSPLMLIWFLAVFLSHVNSHLHSHPPCLWLSIQPSWGLPSALRRIPHWFSLVCELRRPPEPGQPNPSASVGCRSQTVQLPPLIILWARGDKTVW